MIQSKIHLADLNKEGSPVKAGPMSWKQKMRYWPCRVGRFVISGLRKRIFTEANGSHVSQHVSQREKLEQTLQCWQWKWFQSTHVCTSKCCVCFLHLSTERAWSSDIVVEMVMSNVLTYVSKYHSSLKGIKALWIKRVIQVLVRVKYKTEPGTSYFIIK